MCYIFGTREQEVNIQTSGLGTADRGCKSILMFDVWCLVTYMSTELICWEAYRSVCVRDPGKKRIKFGAQGFLDIDFHRCGAGARNPRPAGWKGKLLYLYVYIYIYLTRHVYICNSAICFKHVEGNGTGMFPGPGNKWTEFGARGFLWTPMGSGPGVADQGS